MFFIIPLNINTKIQKIQLQENNCNFINFFTMTSKIK